MDTISTQSPGTQRDRSRRGDRGTRFSDADTGSRDRSESRICKRIYVSNIPYEFRWQDLKDLFRRVVGTVEFVELFMDENGKARGCGIVEFKDPESVQKAMEKMNRYELNGREIVVKEDHGEERDQYGRIGANVKSGGSGGGGAGGGSVRGSGGGMRGGRGRDRDDDRNFMMNRNDGGGFNNSFNDNNQQNDYNDTPFNTYGLSASFLDSLGIQGPLHTKVFVANLDYKVDAKKLKEVFKLAGKLVNVDLATDKDGNSRGFSVVEYEHPVEAVQAISMFDRQMLFERRMTVRLDRVPDKNEAVKLPEGLVSIGIGLGPNGEPLRNVALNLLNMQNQNNNTNNNLNAVGGNNNNMSSMGNNMNSMGGGNMSNMNSNPAPVPVAAPLNGSSSILGPVPNTNLGNNLAALNSVVGSLGNLGALSNPLLSSAAASLSSLGLNLGGSSGGNNDMVGGGGNSSSLSTFGGLGGGNQQQSSNNYNTGYGGNTGGGGGNSNYSNYDMVSSNSVRSYNTAPQDYNQQQQQSPQQNQSQFQSGLGNLGGGGGNNNSGGGNQRMSDTILIKNLPQNCTWQTLRDKFRDVGEVKFAEVRGQDCGVVRFSKERDAELAIKLMDGSRFENRTVAVSFF